MAAYQAHGALLPKPVARSSFFVFQGSGYMTSHDVAWEQSYMLMGLFSNEEMKSNPFTTYVHIPKGLNLFTRECNIVNCHISR